MRLASRRSLLVFVAAVFASGFTQSSSSGTGLSADQAARVRSILSDAVAKSKTAGAVVLVAQNGQVVLLEAVGKRDLESGDPMKADSIFRIYSMTKPITSAAALMLVEEGKLTLDEPVSKYLPEFKGIRVSTGSNGQTEEAKQEITVRDLMRHTSGLSYGDSSDSVVDRLYNEHKVGEVGDLAKMVRDLAAVPLEYQPGTRFHYSYSTDVLGRLVEVVSGKPLDEFLRSHIFKPLGMGDTGFFVPAKSVNRLTSSYWLDPKSGLKVIDSARLSVLRAKPARLSGGGGLISTAHDYWRFCQMLLNKGELDGKRLLRPETVRELTTNQLPPEALPMDLGGFKVPGMGFGLGVSVWMNPFKSSMVGEYGWSGAASTYFWVSPKTDRVVIILQQVQPFNISLQLALQAAF